MYLSKKEKILKVFSYTLLIVTALFSCFPLWMGFIASTSDVITVISGKMNFFIGDNFFQNYSSILTKGITDVSTVTATRLMMNTFIISLLVTTGKIIVSILAAYGLLYFEIPLEKLIFSTIFLTLMLPIEVRIAPTYQVAVNFGMINSFSGIVFPLIASATATFLFREHFLHLPKEIFEAALLNAAGPWKLLKDIIIPMSRNSIIALAVVTFVSTWNQYLWPLLILNDLDKSMINLGIKFVIAQSADGGIVNWPYVMALSMIALIPPVIIIFFLQSFFVKGLSDTEK